MFQARNRSVILRAVALLYRERDSSAAVAATGLEVERESPAGPSRRYSHDSAQPCSHCSRRQCGRRVKRRANVQRRYQEHQVEQQRSAKAVLEKASRCRSPPQHIPTKRAPFSLPCDFF